MTSRIVVGFAFAAAVAFAASPEWGQWAGPTRDFKVAARPISAVWPPSGPRVLWKRPLPFGSSSVVADGKRLYTMYRDGDSEVVIALESATGNTVWEYKYPAAFLKGMNMNTGPGPHATVLIVGDRLYSAGVTGLFHCLNKKTGKALWTRRLIEEMGGTVMLRGYSNSPLRYRDTVIVMVGGKGHAIAALDLKTGATRWQGGDFANSQSSPVLINVDGRPQVACVVDKAVAGFDPATGRVLWSHPHENRGGDITSTLIWGPDNLLFFSGAYQGGSRTLELTRRNGETVVKELWFHSQLRVHHSNVMRIGDYVYAPSGDFAGITYVCVNIRTGKIMWRERRMPRANALLVGDRPILLDEEGSLHLVDLSPDGLKVNCSFPILDHLAWTPPSIAGTRLYVRDRKSIAAVELKNSE
ncbi:MAG TPA: PQQ-binding-like beta-propeller repeat protein [Bryobacteraceae bacterium]|nr:PQQ-binding-like beta-propeller repeat protein [Bryobacteraceae bacterium]